MSQQQQQQHQTAMTKPGAAPPAKRESNSALGTFETVLNAAQADIAKVIPKHLTPERMMRLALSALSRNHLLMKCTPHSVLRSVMDCAKLGLEPTGAIGGAHLVAFWNKKLGAHEAQMITDYRGEMALARRSGEISTIAAHVVYSNDIFDLAYGDDERLVHKPLLEGDRGKAVGVYAIAKLRDGGIQRIYLTRSDVHRYRDKSMAKDNGPWVTDELAMWRKTAIRRLCNMLPRAIEHTEHAEREETTEFGGGFTSVTTAAQQIAAQAGPSSGSGPVIDIAPEPEPDDGPPPPPEPPPPRQSAGDRLAGQLRSQRSPAPESGQQPEAPKAPSVVPSDVPPSDGSPTAAEPSAWKDGDKITEGMTTNLRAQLGAKFAELEQLIGKDKAKAMWNGAQWGVKSLRGLKTWADGRERLEQADQLLKLGQLDIDITDGIRTMQNRVGKAEASRVLAKIAPDLTTRTAWMMGVEGSEEALNALLRWFDDAVAAGPKGDAGDGDANEPWTKDEPAHAGDREPGADG